MSSPSNRRVTGRPSHSRQPHYGRKWHSGRSPHVTGATLALAFLGALSSTALAYRPAYPPMITPSVALDYELHALVVDITMPALTQAPARVKLVNSADEDLRRRQNSRGGGRNDEDEDTRNEDQPQDEDEDANQDEGEVEGDSSGDDETSSSSREKTSTTFSKDDEPTRTTASPTDEATTTDDPTSTTAESSPLPSAFDGKPSSAFRGENSGDSCPIFMSTLLGSSEYTQCYPLSTMLVTSNGLFEAEKQLTSIVRVLDATCAADVEFCTNFLEQAARNLTREENCGAEFDQGQRLVMQAYDGLRAYETVYSATCLQNPETDMYCFASAVTNTTEPSDTYFYFMPLGLNMPGGSNPSCGWCTTETMGIYHSAAADRSQAVADTYENASQQVNTVCGPSFVENTLPEAVEDAARSLAPSLVLVMMALCTAAFFGAAL